MRKQFLYLDKAGYQYNAPGNISITAGSKGTVFFWYHPAKWQDYDQPIWEAQYNSLNTIKLAFMGVSTLALSSTSGGVQTSLDWNGFEVEYYQRWLPVTCTWDFTTPGAGKLRLYVDGVEAPVQVNTATAPEGEAVKLYLGARYGSSSPGLDGHLDNFTIWDDVMTLEQHQALKMGAADAGTRQQARRRRPREGDGAGTLTFLASFDGRYDAEYAAGDPTASWTAPPEEYHQFARIDDGSRSRGRRYAFHFGLPRHDNSEDDRVPVRAVLTLLRYQSADQYTSLVDEADWSEVNISQLKAFPGVGQGVGWLREAVDAGHLLRPATVRMRVHLPDTTNPKGTKICLGPLTYISGGGHGNNFGTWGTGELCTVVADEGNTATSFKTNLTARPDGYWTGAELSVRSGASAGCRLKMTGYTASTGVVTVAGALPATPAAGDKVLVDFRGRLIPTSNPYNEEQSLEAWLWEEYSGDRPWIELETIHGTHYGIGFGRYERGRSVWMDVTDGRSGPEGTHLMFGRNGWDEPSSFNCNIRLESLIIEGPGSYQVMDPADRRLRRGFELADYFLVRDMITGHSSRVWRAENCSWGSASPTVNPSPAQALADLQEAGSWREAVAYHTSIAPWADTESVVASVLGEDVGGAKRLGYVRGTWDAGTNRIQWQTEPAPGGRSNPFLNASELRPTEMSDSTWGMGVDPGVTQVLQRPDGTWTLLVSGNEDNPDHYFVRALHGSPDRYSFDPDRHWWPDNPVVPGHGGVDLIPPMSGGINCWGNRDAEWMVCHNPYAREASRRFAGYARYKTILPLSADIGANRRPVMGWTSSDLKSFYLLPYGNAVSPLGLGEGFTLQPYAVSDDLLGMLVLFYGGVIRLWASDDDRHFQEVIYSFLPDGSPLDTFRLGDKRIYYYAFTGGTNFGYQGYNRETFYQLQSGTTSGMIETAALAKPGDGWGDLIVNVGLEQGSVQVAVLDGETEEEIAGFGASDCDALSDELEQAVTWGTIGLKELTAETIRLQFHLSRTQNALASPKLYSWQVTGPTGAEPPGVFALLVNGETNPTGLTDQTPEFSWTYSDPHGLPQAAYQILVASSAGKLAENEGDLWDSGVVAGDETAVTYDGAELADETMYFWKVRVRNSEGTWSEAW
jgi:hypothetical protein